MHLKTSIIILTYNSQNYIEKLLQSIYEFNKTSDYEVLVVDNNSQDKTVSVAKKFGKTVQVIETGDNLGFAKGINFGTKKAKGEFLLFINPDAEWVGGSQDALVKCFNNPKIGIVGGRIVQADGISELSAGKFSGTFESVVTAFGLDNALGIRFSPSTVKQVDFVSGGFMMVRKSVFDKLDGFDENLFMYVEDMELCFRAKKTGFSTLFTPDIVIKHASHGSSSRAFAIKNIIQGYIYFQKKHGDQFSYNLVRFLYFFKAITLVIVGKIMNNKYLVNTYSQVINI